MLKVVYNAPFGDFTLPKGYLEQYPDPAYTGDYPEYRDISRTDETLIAYLEANPDKELAIHVQTCCRKYRIDEYDGAETVSCPCSDANTYTEVP